MPLLNRTSEHLQYNADRAELTGADARKRSNIVSVPRSKNVQQRKRRTASKDAKTLGKISTFQIPNAPGFDEPLVAHPHPSYAPSKHTTSTPSQLTPYAPSAPTPSNDNNIPVWELTGDLVKVVAATVALQVEDEGEAIGFSFNLTPEATARAVKHPAGFLDRLKRDLDRELSRAGIVELPYWFCVDVDWDKRLHIHGAYLGRRDEVSAFKSLFKQAWGEQSGPGKDKQLHVEPCSVDDGWGSYSMRNQKRVAKIIGPRTFTISQPLRREAQSAYVAIRRIMRGGL